MKSTFFTLRLFIFGVCAISSCEANCGPSEYLSRAGECCPMCNIGLVVLKDCIGDSSTTCKPCSKGTYMNDPNGLPNCFQCRTCDMGLNVLHDCSTIKDTVCEASIGHYCVHDSYGECSHAKKHSECEPGQQIKTPGTKTSDTVCEPCPPGFYSPEGVDCSKWTDCAVNNQIKDQEGSFTIDATCKTGKKKYGLMAAVALTVAVSLLLVIVLYLKHRQANNERGLNSAVEETTLQQSVCAPSSSEGTVPFIAS